MLPATTDVLIVGAGPAGLTAAVALTQHGHAVTIVDAQAEGANTSRAAVIHARTLEVLEPYGVSKALVERGVHTPQFTIRDRDKVLVTVSFDGLPSPYPYTLMIPQCDTEAILLARLHELGGRVMRPARVTAAEQDESGVTVSFEGGEQIRAGHVIGADGMHSVMRSTAGIGFVGSTYEESFVLADVRLSGGVPENEVVLYFSPAGLVVVAPLPDGRHRIVSTVAEAPHEPDAAFVQQLLDARGPVADPVIVREVIWGSRFRVHHRLADSFREGRVLLAGDAAHVHSPAGGQGMNLGIEDGVKAAEALDRVLEGAPLGELEAYASTRRPLASGVIGLAGRLTKVATMADSRRPLRNVALRTLGRIPAFRRRLAWQLSGLDRRD